MTGSMGDLAKASFQLPVLELYERCESVSHLAALPVTVKGLLDVSHNADDATQPRHL
jgi:hypothetical protein